MADGTDMVTMPDGTEREMAGAMFHQKYFVRLVNPDGTEVDLGRAYRLMLTHNHWADEQIDRLKTQVADMKAHEARCPLAQKEASEL